MKTYIKVQTNPLYLVMEGEEHTSKKKTQSGQNYFLRDIPVEELQSTVWLGDERCTLREMHLSVYENYSGEKDFLSPLHLSVTVKPESGNEIKIRFYLDENLRIILIDEDGKNYRLDEKQKKQLESHIQYQTSVDIITTNLSIKLQKEQDKIISELTKKLNKKEDAKDLSTWLTEKNQYFYGGYFDNQIELLQERINPPKIDEVPEKIAEEIATSSSTQKNPVKFPKISPLKTIDKLIASLESDKKAAKIYRTVRLYELYNKKFKLLPRNADDEVCDALRKLNKLQTEIFFQFQEACAQNALEDVKLLSTIIRTLKGKLSKMEEELYHRGIFIALQKGHEDIIKHVVLDNKDKNFNWYSWGATPLFVLKKNGHIALMKWLIEHADANPDQKSVLGNSLLGDAAFVGDTEQVRYLINIGCDVNTQEIPMRKMAHYVMNEQDKKVEASINSELENKTINGGTPLLFSIGGEHYDITLLLLENGADPRLSTNIGFSPIASLLDNMLRTLYKGDDGEDTEEDTEEVNQWNSLVMRLYKQRYSLKTSSDVKVFWDLFVDIHKFVESKKWIKEEEHIIFEIAEKIFLKIHPNSNKVKAHFHPPSVGESSKTFVSTNSSRQEDRDISPEQSTSTPQKKT